MVSALISLLCFSAWISSENAKRASILGTGIPLNGVWGELTKLETERIIVSDGPLESAPYPMWYHKYLEVPKEGQVGHNTRGVGIEAATGDFIVLTNEDNYFVQGFRHRLESNIKDDTGMVIWNGINNLWKYTDYGGSKLERGFIDLSFAAVKSDIAKKIGYPWRHYDSDFDYLEACYKEVKRRKLKLVTLKETLSIHN